MVEHRIASMAGATEPVTNGMMVKGTNPTAIALSTSQCNEPWALSGFGPTYASLTVPTMYPGGCGICFKNGMSKLFALVVCRSLAVVDLVMILELFMPNLNIFNGLSAVEYYRMVNCE